MKPFVEVDKQAYTEKGKPGLMEGLTPEQKKNSFYALSRRNNSCKQPGFFRNPVAQ